MKCLSLLFSLFASALAAECPTRQHVEGPGVLLFHRGGELTLFARSSPHHISSIRYAGGTAEFHLLLAEGFYFGGRVAGSTSYVDTPVGGYGALPDPSAADAFAVTMNLGGAPEGRQATMTYSGGTQTTVELSGCSYRAVDFDYSITYSSNTGVSAGQIRFLPDLGISYGLDRPARGIAINES